MIIPDKKKAVSIILSKMGAGGAEQSAPLKPEEEMGDGAELHAIAEDLLMAVEQKSAAAVKDALQAFLACVQNEDQEQDA
jgi:hypothetical protein